MNPEVSRQIEQLRSEISNARREFDAYKKTSESVIEGLVNELKTHTHGGTDGSSMIYNDSINLKPGQQFTTGNFALAEQTGTPEGNTEEVMRGFFIMGDDLNQTDGIQNAQITFEHQKSTNGTTNQTFFYAFRSPLFIGSDASVSSGATMTTEQYAFEKNSLIGAYCQVTDPATGVMESYVIASNTANVVTISGTWGFTAVDALYIIFVPVYLGSAATPWRRVYTTSGDGGGIRFGVGDTAEGQNGLLYMDSAGDLYWRDDGGVSTKLN